jgi:LPXTG-site transpeptidase (sortase) family protein
MDTIFDRILAQKFVFLGTFFVVFTISYMVLMAIDFLPEPPTAQVDTEVSEIEERVESSQPSEVVPVIETATSSEVVEYNPADALPLTISIAKLNRTVTVQNPTSRAIADLDTALLTGVVRHPDSATLEQDGTVFILGHSSYLPQVLNKNFQAFNGIQDLEWGDVIEVTTADAVYEYRVEKVYRARAQDLTVPIAGTEKSLTLATCNSFGSLDDRYIVEAKQMTVRKS